MNASSSKDDDVTVKECDENFESQDDDEVFMKAYEAFESANISTDLFTLAADDFSSDSQDTDLYLACEAYERDHADEHESHEPPMGAKGGSLSSADAGVPKLEIKPRPKHKYLTVSNLVSQLWCEQQMIYGFWPSLDFIEPTPAMVKGNKMHVKKDRAVNTYEKVAVKTPEDTYGIRLINIIHHLKSLLVLGKPCLREVPIFGMPLGQGVLVVGTVDELRFDSYDRLELVEFKTRDNIAKPASDSQMNNYKLQTMLYKLMLDDLVTGQIDGEAVLSQLKLDSTQPLSSDLRTILMDQCETCTNLGELMSTALKHFQFLPAVQVLTLEFGSRDDNDMTVVKKTVEFDSDWLQLRLEHCFAYWSGAREATGVDIEEAWKCRSCPFEKECEWRIKMNQLYARKNLAGKQSGH